MPATEMIYLDHAATTPVDPDVVAAMMPFWTETYGNPSSVHRTGQRALYALEEARARVAAAFNVGPRNVVFTGCGSESDNLALRGVMLGAAATGRNHLITSVIEHKAVLATAKQLANFGGCELTVLPVDADGRVAVADVAAAIRPGQTALISIMAANNEIGTLQPVDEIGALARRHDVLFHTDAVQQVAFQAWDLQRQPLDMLSVAAHKFYGPKGVGALIVRDGVDLKPMLTGGGQEEGRRAGTSNVAFAVGLARALEIAAERREADVPRYRAWRDALIERLLAALGDEIRLTGHPTERLVNHASFALRHISGNDLLVHLDLAGVAASSGSACLVGNPEPSAVLQALGLDDAWALGGLRLTFGRTNREEHVARAAQAVIAAANAMRALIPAG